MSEQEIVGSGSDIDPDDFKPFHESLPGILNQVWANQELDGLGKLIRVTKIPTNHEMIADSWRIASKRTGSNIAEADDPVLQSVFAQAEEVRRKAEAESADSRTEE